jgi:hypothetical protein
MESLAKFKTIKSLNERFKNFVTCFQENERLIATKFKSAKILFDIQDRELDLKLPLSE